MKLKVTNPTTGIKYGNWDLKVLVKALSAPFEFEEPGVASSMLYDLSGDELEFTILNSENTGSVSDVHGESSDLSDVSLCTDHGETNDTSDERALASTPETKEVCWNCGYSWIEHHVCKRCGEKVPKNKTDWIIVNDDRSERCGG